MEQLNVKATTIRVEADFILVLSLIPINSIVNHFKVVRYCQYKLRHLSFDSVHINLKPVQLAFSYLHSGAFTLLILVHSHPCSEKEEDQINQIKQEVLELEFASGFSSAQVWVIKTATIRTRASQVIAFISKQEATEINSNSKVKVVRITEA